MKLYKYRSAGEGFWQVHDILLKERLYCSEYQKLNDPFEGQFIESSTQVNTVKAGESQLAWLSSMQTPRAVSSLNPSVPETRILSLSASNSDVRMWSIYASSHTGCAIEIDFNGLDDHTEIIYEEKLKVLGENEKEKIDAKYLLSHKTNHWQYEQEYRIFSAEKYYSVKSRITAVYLGIHIGQNEREIIQKIAPSNTQIVPMKLDHDSVEITPDK